MKTRINLRSGDSFVIDEELDSIIKKVSKDPSCRWFSFLISGKKTLIPIYNISYFEGVEK